MVDAIYNYGDAASPWNSSSYGDGENGIYASNASTNSFQNPYGGAGYDSGRYRIFGGEDEDETLFGVRLKTLYVTLGAVVLLFCFLRKLPAIRTALQRRAAANAARVAARDSELEPVNSWFGMTSVVKVHLELDGVTHCIGAARDDLTTVNQLPFVLADACEESGAPELIGLDLVDLCIKKRAELHYDTKGGGRRPVGGTTVLDDLMKAKAFHVRVLPEPPAAGALSRLAGALESV